MCVGRGAREFFLFLFLGHRSAWARDSTDLAGGTMATQAAPQTQGSNPLVWVQTKQKAAGQAFQAWMKRQPPYVEVAVATLGGATQGVRTMMNT